jgi:hypothetical protein
MKGWAVIVGILILGMIISSGCTQPASSPSPQPTTSIQPTPQVTEQTSQPTPQPTVEVTKAQEKPLPLTETYSYHTGRFNFKYPSGYEVYSTVDPGDSANKWRYLLIANKELEDSFAILPATSPATNPDSTRYYLTTLDGKLIYIDYRKIVQNSVVKVEIEDMASNDAWIWASNNLRHQKNGSNYWYMTYDTESLENVKFNDVSWVKIINGNTRTLPTTPNVGRIWLFTSGEILWQDWNLTSDEHITYFLRYLTPSGAFVLFEYDVNAKWDGEPMPKGNFNQATFEEIVKSFKYEEI